MQSTDSESENMLVAQASMTAEESRRVEANKSMHSIFCELNESLPHALMEDSGK